MSDTQEGSGVVSAPEPKKSQLLLIVVIITVGAVIVAIVGILVLKKDGTTGQNIVTATPPANAAVPVQREPINSAVDPFAVPMGSDQAIQAVQTAAPTTVDGGKEGLYGGTLDMKACDKEKLTKFLVDNPDKGAEWARVLGIQQADIPTYIAGLTPVLLRSDTAVTNHGFKNGKAFALQSILQAGTAVLVNDKGVPVTKCYCGNPLLPPVFTSHGPPTTTTSATSTTYTTTTTYYEEPPTYYGPEWPGFTPTSITIITIHVEVIQVFVLVDPATGKTFQRPVGTDGSQDVSSDQPEVTTTQGQSTATTQKPYNPTTTTTYYETTTTTGCCGTTTTMPMTTTTFATPDEPCVDENGHIVTCPGG